MMESRYILCICFIASMLLGCEKESVLNGDDPVILYPPVNNGIPEGYFIADFSSGLRSIQTKQVSGEDNRISHLKSIVYKSSGEFVKERILFTPQDGIANWPFEMVSDTLPLGDYRALFLGNIDKSLFPYPDSNNEIQYSEVLVDYKSLYQNARILLPNAPFTPSTEYYLANVTFSHEDPNPTILLQRIISSLRVQRHFVDAREALNQLLENIVSQMGYRDIISNTVSQILPSYLTEAIRGIPLIGFLLELIGAGIDVVVNLLLDSLLQPIVDFLYDRVLKELIDRLGATLVGNTGEEGLLNFLTHTLNPWNEQRAESAIVTVNGYANSIDFNLNTCNVCEDGTRLKVGFEREGDNGARHINLKGFNNPYVITDVKVVSEGLLSGLIINGVIDDFLLSGAFINIQTPLNVSDIHTGLNRRHQANYSLPALQLTSTAPTDDSLAISIKLGDIAGIDNIISSIPLIGPIVNSLLSPLKNIGITLTLGVPILDINNMESNGGWDEIFPY